MAEEISRLQESLTLMEIYCRRMNLLFYGIKETPDENVENLLRDTFVYLGLSHDEAATIALVNAHRLPRRNAPTQPNEGSPQAPAPRAIIAKFVYMKDRNKVFAAFDERQRQRQPRSANASAATDPQETRRITVRTDLPPALKATRSSLAKIAYNMRKERNVSTKISVAGTRVLLYWKERGTAVWNQYKD